MRVFVDDVARFRAVSADVAARIRAVAEADGNAVSIGLPQDPGQAGKSQIMFLTQMLADFGFRRHQRRDRSCCGGRGCIAGV